MMLVTVVEVTVIVLVVVKVYMIVIMAVPLAVLNSDNNHYHERNVLKR